MNILDERYLIAIDRTKEIINENTVDEPFKTYFKNVAEFILQLDSLKNKIENNQLDEYSLEQLEQLNDQLYSDVYKVNYDHSFANPTFAVKTLGQDFGQVLCYIYKKVRDLIGNIYRRETEITTLRIELFLEIYYYFENKEELAPDNIKETIYSFERDNSEIFSDNMVDWRVNPDRTFATDIVMDSDLTDLRYLYRYGEHVGYNETAMATYLNSLPQEEIDKLAYVYTNGYQVGFIQTGKDLSIKDTVDIRYNIGFERIIRALIPFG